MSLPVTLRIPLCSALLLTAAAGRAGDWPQILGPTRNGVAAGETLPDKFPSGGPKALWTFAAGAGYAGPVVVDKTVVLFHRVGGSERVEALDADTGKSRWKTDFPASYRGGIDPDLGPRAMMDADVTQACAMLR